MFTILSTAAAPQAHPESQSYTQETATGQPLQASGGKQTDTHAPVVITAGQGVGCQSALAVRIRRGRQASGMAEVPKQKGGLYTPPGSQRRCLQRSRTSRLRTARSA